MLVRLGSEAGSDFENNLTVPCGLKRRTPEPVPAAFESSTTALSAESTATAASWSPCASVNVESISAEPSGDKRARNEEALKLGMPEAARSGLAEGIVFHRDYR